MCTTCQQSSTRIGWPMNAVPTIYLPQRLPFTKFLWKVPSGRWILTKPIFSSCLCMSRVNLARRQDFRGLDMRLNSCKQQWSMCPRKWNSGIATVEGITFSSLHMTTVPVFIPWWDFRFFVLSRFTVEPRNWYGNMERILQWVPLIPRAHTGCMFMESCRDSISMPYNRYFPHWRGFFFYVENAGVTGNCTRNTWIYAKFSNSSDLWSTRLPSLSSSRTHTNPPIHLALSRCFLHQGSLRATTTKYICVL